MGFSEHVDNKKNYILILGEGPIKGLDSTTWTEGKKYSVNFNKTDKKSCLSLHYNGANSYWFVNGVEIIKSIAKDSDFVAIPLCLENISKYFSEDNMKKTGSYGYVNHFSVDISVADILDIHQCLLKKNEIL